MTIIHRAGRRFVSRLLQLMPDLALARRGESEILERAIRGVKSKVEECRRAIRQGLFGARSIWSRGSSWGSTARRQRVRQSKRRRRTAGVWWISQQMVDAVVSFLLFREDAARVLWPKLAFDWCGWWGRRVLVRDISCRRSRR